MANKNFKVKNGLDIQSPLDVSMGGTGQTTTTNTLNSLLPSQAGNSNKILSTDGTNTTWAAQSVAYQRGGTASRPASPTAGDLYYNTDTNIFEQYISTGWFAVAAVPGTPTGVTATNQGTGRAFNNGQASVAFTAGTSGGASSTFILTPTPATSPSTFTGSSSPIIATNLASSTQYTYTVSGTSAYGTSSASSASAGVTATTVPQAPTISAASASETTATITLTAGATGGAAISQYSIISNPVTTTQTTSSSPYTFTGLTQGTSYAFTATATNSNGTSSASSASNSIIPEPADSGAMLALGSIIVPASGTSLITFSNIPLTYKHLQIRIMSRDARSALLNNLQMQINGTTGSPSYTYHSIIANAGAASVTADGGTGGGATDYIYEPSASVSASVFGISVFDILDYTSTVKNKTIRMIGGYDDNSIGRVNLSSSLWNSPNAVTSLYFRNSSNTNFVQFSSFSLYGIK